MNYIICDDNKEFAESLKMQLIKLEPDCTVIIYNSAEELRFNLPDVASITDAIFMDIMLDNDNGIIEAVNILKSFPNIRVIYVTGYGEEFSQDIFSCPPDITPTAFLIKPIKTKYLKNALERIKAYSPAKEQPFLIKNGNEKSLVQPKEIIYISVQGRIVTIVTKTSLFRIHSSIKDCINRLPKYFVQCQKSYCVNLQHIKRIINWTEVIMTDSSIIPVSRRYLDSFKKAVTAMYSELPG